jgi:hypothetical protein
VSWVPADCQSLTFTAPVAPCADPTIRTCQFAQLPNSSILHHFVTTTLPQVFPPHTNVHHKYARLLHDFLEAFTDLYAAHTNYRQNGQLVCREGSDCKCLFPSSCSATRYSPPPQILRGIFAFHDIKNSQPLLQYLAKEIGEGKLTAHALLSSC